MGLRAVADRTVLRAEASDLAFVAIELADADGVLATGSDRQVTVEVSGAGVLAGMCSANPKTSERFAAGAGTTFDGRALAVVRPTGAGRISVRVTAEGLAPVALEVEAR